MGARVYLLSRLHRWAAWLHDTCAKLPDTHLDMQHTDTYANPRILAVVSQYLGFAV
jgi:hypothetical protein